MTDHPLISVVMAAYNEERYIGDAIRSILEQTCRDFEFIIIDDCSTDKTASILRELAGADSRIRIITNGSNKGLTKSLNVGIEQARGEFIARMDADDISDPTRFEKQLKVFFEHPDIVLCGTFTLVINEVGKPEAIGEWPEDPGVLKWYSIFRPAVAHPTAMFRTALVGQGIRYNEALKSAQDYELWSRMQAYGGATVLPIPLLKYRNHGSNISYGKRDEQRNYSMKICADNLRATFPQLFSGDKREEPELIAGFVHGGVSQTSEQITAAITAITTLEENYLDTLKNATGNTGNAVKRLTGRWLLQAILRQKTISPNRYLPAIWMLKCRLPSLIEEAFFYLGRRIRARRLA